jgi:hypothetical protein
MSRQMIRPKFLAAAAMAAMTVSAPAFAQPAPNAVGNVDVFGSVASRCLFTTPSAVINLGELSIQGAAANSGQVDPAKVNAGHATLNGWCNGAPATMSVQTFALVDTSYTTSPPTGFDRVVNYTATASNGAAAPFDDSLSPGPGAPVVVGIFAHDINVQLSAPSTPNSGRLIAGTYQGQVVVTLSPNVVLNNQ